MFPTADQIAMLPPELQQIVKDIGVNDPAVWQYLFILAVRKLGVLKLTTDELHRCPGAGIISVCVNTEKNNSPAEMKIFFQSTDQQVRMLNRLRQSRAKAGKDPMTTMAIDTRSFDFTKKQ
jgi:hypothetical protein